MRVISVLVLGLLVACGESAPTAQPDTAPAGIELPVSGTLGALPPPAGRITIVVDHTGALSVDEQACPWAELGARLGAYSRPESPVNETEVQEVIEEVEDVAPLTKEEVDEPQPPSRDSETPGPREPGTLGDDGSANADVLLRIDGRVPWSVVMKVLVTCAHPDRKLWRIFYAVRGEDGAGEGALAVFLPKDMGCGPADDLVVESIRMRARPGSGPPRSTTALARAIRVRMPTPTSVLAVTLRPDPRMPFREVVRVLDAGMRAGALGLTLDGPPVSDLDPLAACRAAAQVPELRWTFSSEALMNRPAIPAAGPSRAPGYCGVTNSLSMLEEEIEEDPEDD